MILSDNTSLYLVYFNIACSVDCEWNQFGNWSSCSETCGGGEKSRTRSKKTEEQNGGRCPGKAIETNSCNTDSCPSGTFKGSSSKFDVKFVCLWNKPLRRPMNITTIFLVYFKKLRWCGEWCRWYIPSFWTYIKGKCIVGMRKCVWNRKLFVKGMW